MHEYAIKDGLRLWMRHKFARIRHTESFCYWCGNLVTRYQRCPSRYLLSL